MLIKRPRGWELPERLVTPEAAFLNRRHSLAAAAAAGVMPWTSGARAEGLYPAKLNPAFADAGRPLTAEEVNTTYNNYYEFGSSKRISRAAEALTVSPWPITIDGLVEKPMTLDVEDLLKQVTLEERIVRHRCVEAWSMVVPWTGFPLKQLIALAKPKPEAAYVRFQTFMNPEVAPGQKPGLFTEYPWPYTEGLTIAEAMNDLAFMVTGAYGKPLAKSMGAPLRLHVPWKYGFKSAKALVNISFTAERPVSFWETLAVTEYGFWANVNPEVPHPRWSQAEETVLGSGERVPTLLYNGYGEWVASLYEKLGGEMLYF
jgi:methionine sulfoxide reductase catalytic subunit